ncbi:hypothetical protein TL16_g01129 [Triparma laevis f. inornata]|uniref:Leucine-rich repeat domain-containing protein n=2 Tax=Triparma laevis TaxID=1534972 RepID=A0A9W7FC95_9STRA|nr:hypothetical protein TL16_g01129 [Triparma laevis f. inornata]GMI09520.1 hypothetical protein TrLO_g1290 [Triparma laevis f. longispina]
MTIPESLQTIGEEVFHGCSKLVPSNIDVSEDNENDVSSEVVLYFRSQQRIASLGKIIAALTTENVALRARGAEHDAKVAALNARIAQLEISLLTPPPNNFISTIDFKRHFVELVLIEMLLVLRELCKEWNDVVIERVDESVTSGVMIVHDGKDLSVNEAYARRDRRELVTQVIFLRNVTKVGDYACAFAHDLEVVDIPESVKSIGNSAFEDCTGLTTVSFPTTLKSIGCQAFCNCSSLDNVNLLHTNVEELGRWAFGGGCSELTSMTIPDSLQTLGDNVFYYCQKLVPSNIDVDWNSDQSAVVTYLRSLQN